MRLQDYITVNWLDQHIKNSAHWLGWNESALCWFKILRRIGFCYIRSHNRFLKCSIDHNTCIHSNQSFENVIYRMIYISNMNTRTKAIYYAITTKLMVFQISIFKCESSAGKSAVFLYYLRIWVRTLLIYIKMDREHVCQWVLFFDLQAGLGGLGLGRDGGGGASQSHTLWCWWFVVFITKAPG